MTLTEAARELGLDTSTLRRQIARGSLRARKVGPVWTVTLYEVARYRANHLGRHASGPIQLPRCPVCGRTPRPGVVSHEHRAPGG